MGLVLLQFLVLLASPMGSFVQSSPGHIDRPGGLRRGLYASFPVEGGHYSVDTISNNITKPSGVAAGFFKGHYGLFISSTAQYTISFFHYRTFERTLVAGVPNTYGTHNAQLLYSHFASPTRMAYDFSNNRLYVAERRSGYIRVLDFPSDQTKTLVDSSTQENLRLQYNIQTGSTYPGMDLQIGGDVLYAVDTVKLYSITAADGSGLTGLVSSGATLTEYTSLSQYFSYKGYEFSASLRSCIYAVAPDTKRNMLYVTVSYARNLILQVPMDPSEPYTAISVLLGDESAKFMGYVGGSIPPAIQNGNLYTEPENGDVEETFTRDGQRKLSDIAYPHNILLSFPIHIRLSSDNNVLYFSEAYPTQSSDVTLFGSLSIRRLVFATGEVDSYAGVDFSHSNATGYEVIGGEGGTLDGLVDEAEFVYPISFAVVDTELGDTSSSFTPELKRALSKSTAQMSRSVNGVNRHLSEEHVKFDTLVIADHSTHSVRRAFAFMDTSAPSSVPTAYIPPTPSPSFSPTSMFSSSSDISSNIVSKVIFSSLVVFSIIFIGASYCCVCHIRRKKKELAKGCVEMNASRSSANMFTFLSYKTLNLVSKSNEELPQYEEMDSSHSAASLCSINMESNDSEDSVEKKWSDLSPDRKPTSRGIFNRLWRAGDGDRERDIAIHSLLDVSDSSLED